MKIAVAGTGYVGLSISVLLAQHNQVWPVDIVPEKVALIAERKSPIADQEIEQYLAAGTVAHAQEPFSPEAFAAAVAGGCAGFLSWNFYPARCFMGDTGSMFLGGAVVAAASASMCPARSVTAGSESR